MDGIKNTALLVKVALINDKKARDSDSYLYYLICKAKLKADGIDIAKVSFEEGLLQRHELGIPNFETVRRTRQKLQHDFPELSGTKEVEMLRAVREQVFKDYAKG